MEGHGPVEGLLHAVYQLTGGNNVYYAWLRTVSATGVAPLARGTARSTSPTPVSPRHQAAAVVAH